MMGMAYDSARDHCNSEVYKQLHTVQYVKDMAQYIGIVYCTQYGEVQCHISSIDTVLS